MLGFLPGTIYGEESTSSASGQTLVSVSIGDKVSKNGIQYTVNAAGADQNPAVTVTSVSETHAATDNLYGTFVIPEQIVLDSVTYDVTAIGTDAFIDVPVLKNIVIGNSVVNIDKKAFDQKSEDAAAVADPESVTPASGEVKTTEDKISENTTIYAPEDSAAVQFAKDNQIDYSVNALQISIDKASLKAGETASASVLKQPEWFGTSPAYNWTSSDPAIAAVDSSGQITAVSAGNAVITAEYSGITATAAITVEAEAAVQDEPAALSAEEPVSVSETDSTAATDSTVPKEDLASTTKTSSDFLTVANNDGMNIVSYKSSTDDKYYLFLPRNIDTTNLTLYCNTKLGSTDKGTLNSEGYQISGDFSGNPEIKLKKFGSSTSIKVRIWQSTLPSMSITLAEGKTIADVEKDKDTPVTGNTVSVTGGEEGTDITDLTIEMKGRGNATWGYAKKPYQIKFDKKTSVLGMSKAKKWVLLANHVDGSLLRNKTSYDLAQSMGLSSPDSKFVDLWVNGEYRGNYLVAQKVDINTGLVSMSDDDGVLVELDNSYGTAEETYFQSKTSNSTFVLKESNSDSTTYFNGGFQTNLTAFEKELYKSSKDWDKIKAYIDVDSFAKYYLLEEYCANYDAMKGSTYLYQDGASDVIHMGPVWDMDNALGNYSTSIMNVNSKWVTRTDTKINTWYQELMKIPQFKQIVSDTYNQYAGTINTAVNNVQSNADAVNFSARMNYKRWGKLAKNGLGSTYSSDYQTNVDSLKSWMSNRYVFMNKTYTSSGSSGSSATLTDGKIYKITSALDSTKVLEIAGSSRANKANLQLGTWSDSYNQEFIARKNSDGTYTLVNYQSNKSVDVVNNASLNGTNVQQYDTNGTMGQRFTVTESGNGYYQIASSTSGKALDVTAGSTANGANIQIYDANGSAAQQFSFTEIGTLKTYSGTYTFKSQLNTGKVIDVKNGSLLSGANVQLYSGNGSSAQKWTIEFDGGSRYIIRNVKSGMVLDVTGGSTKNGGNIQQYYGNQSGAQRWKIVSHSDGSVSLLNDVSDLAVDVKGASTSNGANIQTYKYNNSKAQRWNMTQN